MGRSFLRSLSFVLVFGLLITAAPQVFAFGGLPVPLLSGSSKDAMEQGLVLDLIEAEKKEIMIENKSVKDILPATGPIDMEGLRNAHEANRSIYTSS